MSNLPPLPLVGGALLIDNSGFMEGVSTCTRYLQYKTLNLRIPTGEKAALNFGSAAHLGKELRYCRYQNRPVDAAFYEDLSTILTEFYDEHPVPTDDWRNLNYSMELERKYNEKYETEEFNLLKYDKPIKCPHCEGTGQKGNSKGELIGKCLWCLGSGTREVMVEMSFSLPLFTWKGLLPLSCGANRHDFNGPILSERYYFEIPVIYTGKIDLPVSLDGQIWTMDHKTSSQMGKQFFDEMRMTAQMRGYAWAFQEITGQKVAGYIVNGIRTKEIPKYVSEGKTLSRGGKTSNADSWWGDTLQRERFYLSPGALDEWKNNTIDLVEEFFWHYSRDYMPLKTKWCAIYGRCPYFDVCTMAPEDRGTMLASGAFTNNTWSPLKQPTQNKQ